MTTNVVSQRLTITVAEAAERLGIGKNAAYEAARAGLIPSIRIGKRVLIPIAAFERMLQGETTRQLANSAGH